MQKNSEKIRCFFLHIVYVVNKQQKKEGKKHWKRNIKSISIFWKRAIFDVCNASQNSGQKNYCR